MNSRSYLPPSIQLPETSREKERRKAAHDLEKHKLALSVYLEEYKSLRTQQMQCVQTQNQAFNFLMIVIAAAVGGIVTAATTKPGNNDPNYFPLLATGIALVLSAVSTSLGCIFFDNEIAINSAGDYLFWIVRLRLKHDIITTTPIIDARGGKDILDNFEFYDRLPNPATGDVFRRLTWGRWYPFIIAALVPWVLAIIGAAWCYQYFNWKLFDIGNTVKIIKGCFLVAFFLNMWLISHIVQAGRLMCKIRASKELEREQMSLQVAILINDPKGLTRSLCKVRCLHNLKVMNQPLPLSVQEYRHLLPAKERNENYAEVRQSPWHLANAMGNVDFINAIEKKLLDLDAKDCDLEAERKPNLEVQKINYKFNPDPEVGNKLKRILFNLFGWC